MILNILILVILILLNGVLSASELAFLSIEKFELDKMIRKRKKNAKKIRKILREERDKGKIIILASHIKEDILGLADVVYEIDAGVVSKKK